MKFSSDQIAKKVDMKGDDGILRSVFIYRLFHLVC